MMRLSKHRHTIWGLSLCTAIASSWVAQASEPLPLPAGSKYVAMGSSFGAGIGIDPLARPSDRCRRSAANYPHLVASRRGLTLVDVTCSGATTEHILRDWRELPAQIKAVTSDTGLVTITIGGNDIGYVALLSAYSCQHVPIDDATRAIMATCPKLVPPSDGAYRVLRANLEVIVEEVRRRAPAARIVFLQYPTLLPSHKLCGASPVSVQQAIMIRRIGQRLARTTADAAQASQVELVKTQALSRGHDICSVTPWINGFPAPASGDGIFNHPNRAGMIAQADALDRLLGK